MGSLKFTSQIHIPHLLHVIPLNYFFRLCSDASHTPVQPTLSKLTYWESTKIYFFKGDFEYPFCPLM